MNFRFTNTNRPLPATSSKMSLNILTQDRSAERPSSPGLWRQRLKRTGSVRGVNNTIKAADISVVVASSSDKQTSQHRLRNQLLANRRQRHCNHHQRPVQVGNEFDSNNNDNNSYNVALIFGRLLAVLIVA